MAQHSPDVPTHLRRPDLYDECPKCGRLKRTKNSQCGTCKGYGHCRPDRGDGYVGVWRPGHPLADSRGYVPEHRLVVYEAGIEIPPGYSVHHVNGIKNDNRLENLQVMEPGEHHRLHARLRREASA